MQSVYDAAGAMEGFVRLAHAWHARVMADEVVSHDHPVHLSCLHTNRFNPFQNRLFVHSLFPALARNTMYPC